MSGSNKPPPPNPPPPNPPPPNPPPPVPGARSSPTPIEVVTHIALGVAILAAVMGMAFLFRSEAREESRSWLSHLRYSDSGPVCLTPLSIAAKPAEAQRLWEQMQEIQGRARFHLNVMEYFYARHFATLTTATILAICAALCLTYIVKVGWSAANRYVVTMFVVLSATATFYGLSPALYQQRQNIDDNKSLYLQYLSLDNTVRTYVATGMQPDSEKPVSLPEFLRYVDKRLELLNQLPLGFDQSQVLDYRSLKIIEPR